MQQIQRAFLIFIMPPLLIIAAYVGGHHFLGKGPLYKGKFAATWVQESEQGTPSEIIEEMGDKAVPTLIRLLRNDDSGLRAKAAYHLWESQELETDAVPGLIALLGRGTESSGDVAACAWASKALEKAPNATIKDYVPQLADALSITNATVRTSISKILTRQGEDASLALPGLAELVRSDPNSSVRYRALFAAVAVAPFDKETEHLIQDALNDEDPVVRRLANQFSRFGGEIGEE